MAFAEPGTGPSTISVLSTATVLDQFEPKYHSTFWLSVENTDGVDSVSISVQVRLVKGSGSWHTTTNDAWSTIVPGEVRVDTFDGFGAAEIRIIGTCTGASADCIYIRRNASRHNASHS